MKNISELSDVHDEDVKPFMAPEELEELLTDVEEYEPDYQPAPLWQLIFAVLVFWVTAIVIALTRG